MKKVIDLGKIGITLAGEYNDKTIYEKLTIVLYKGKSYISTKTIQGISPEEDIRSWQLVAEAKDAYHMLIDAGKTTLTEEEFLEQLVDATKGRYIVQGNVINAADEEDLTIEHSDLLGIDTLKLANRPSTDGMGYVILRKNKSFAEQVTKENTIYEIRYDFDLYTQIVRLPKNSVLCFKGGSIKNGSILGNPKIDAPLYQIFYNITTDVRTVYAEWIGVLPMSDYNNTADNFQNFINNHVAYDTNYGNELTIYFSYKYPYNFGHSIEIPEGITVKVFGVDNGGYNTTIVARFETGTLFTVYGKFTATDIGFQGLDSSNITFINIKKSDYTGDNPNDNVPESVNDTDSVFKFCTFYHGDVCIRLTGRQNKIYNCTFTDSHVGVLLEDLRTTGNYGAGRNNVIDNCNFHGYFNEAAIKCTGIAQKHLEIINNIKDVGSGPFFKGHLISGRITGNTIHYPITGDAIIILSNANYAVISNNKMCYDNDLPNGTSSVILSNNLKHFITTSYNVTNLYIINNVFSSCLEEGFVLQDIRDSIITGNIFTEINTSKDTDKNVLIKHNYSSDCYFGNNILKKAIPSITNDIVTSQINSISLSDSSDSFEKNPIIRGSKLSGFKYYLIGKVTGYDCVGGALIVAGSRNSDGQVTYMLNVSRENGRQITVRCECITQNDQFGTLYIDSEYNLYWRNDYQYGGIIYINQLGYGTLFTSPKEIDTSSIELLDVTLRKKGNTSQRPKNNMLNTNYIGFVYFDTTLNKPIYWTGSKWVDATGVEV